MKNKKIIISIVICIIVLGLLTFFTYKLTHKTSTINTSSTSKTTKTSNSIDLSNLETTDVTLSESYEITKAGIYNLTGEIKDGLITINTEDNVKLILNNVSITNSSGPCINVINAKNVIIELNGENTLVDGSNYKVDDEDVDAVIFSKDDLFIQGDGTLNITANYNDGITSKDDLTIDSGIINITSTDDAIKGKDSLTINGGTITINSKGDGIKSTNDSDIEKGIITINGGSINITSTKDGFDSANKFIMNNGTINIKSDDDGIHADGYLEVNDGTINIDAVEGLEATYIKINGGNIDISASDDGINAANKSSNYSVTVEINGGNITIKMGQGDTDGIDSNGNLYINGGTINITGNSPFDYDGEAKYTGGTMIINGEETTEITNQFMGGGRGGMMQQGPGQDNSQRPEDDAQMQDRGNMQGRRR